MLTGSENIEDFREVTDAEKTALEASDAVWVRPPQSFIDRANSVGMIYNEVTGFVELNGLTDISYEEALQIFNYSHTQSTTEWSDKYSHIPKGIRTLLPLRCAKDNNVISKLLFSCQYIEVISFLPNNSNRVGTYGSWNNTFDGCYNLKKVLTPLRLTRGNTFFAAFKNCSKLEHVELQLAQDFNLSYCPLLSHHSIHYLITYAYNTSAIVITVHPEVFAKIADEDNEEWHALLTMAMEKNIQFASA